VINDKVLQVGGVSRTCTDISMQSLGHFFAYLLVWFGSIHSACQYANHKAVYS